MNSVYFSEIVCRGERGFLLKTRGLDRVRAVHALIKNKKKDKNKNILAR